MDRRLLLVPLFAILVLGLMAVGCSDDPAEPDPGPGRTPSPFPITPDSLVSLFASSLADMDTLIHPALYGTGCFYGFSDGDIAANGLAASTMTKAEALQAVLAMFSGEPVVNGLGQTMPAITGIEVAGILPWEDWRDAPPESPLNGTLVAVHEVRVDLERGLDQSLLAVSGALEFYARPVERDDGQGGTRTGYELAALVDPGTAFGGKSETLTLGMALYLHLANEPPTAALQVRPTGTFPTVGLELDARQSEDLDSGLHHEAFRWRAAADSAWTGWKSQPLTRLVYADTGLVTVAVEVRDRWGLSDLAEQQVRVPAAELPFPATPDLLMANYRTVYDNAVESLIDDLLRAEHVTYLDTLTAEAWPQLNGFLTRTDELASVLALFAGEDGADADGNPVPGVGYISFGTLAKVVDWTLAGPLDRVPGAMKATYEVGVFLNRWDTDDLQVTSTVDFYAAARDSLHEDVLQDYWQLVGQEDHGPSAKASLPITWSALKVVFRPQLR